MLVLFPVSAQQCRAMLYTSRAGIRVCSKKRVNNIVEISCMNHRKWPRQYRFSVCRKVTTTLCRATA